MNKQLIKTFSSVKEHCKTKDQRLAFNKLVKSFDVDQDYVDFKKIAKELGSYNGPDVFETNEFEKFEKIHKNIQPEFVETVYELLGYDTFGPGLTDTAIRNIWDFAWDVSRRTGTEIKFFIEFAEDFAKFVKKFK